MNLQYLNQYLPPAITYDPEIIQAAINNDGGGYDFDLIRNNPEVVPVDAMQDVPVNATQDDG